MTNLFYKSLLLLTLFINSVSYGENNGGIYRVIYKENKTNYLGSCVAFDKDENHIYYLTAGHLFPKKSKDHKVIVNDINYDLVKVKSFYTKDMNEDLLIVRSILIKNVLTYPISKETPKNQRVIQVGYPAGIYRYESVVINDVRHTAFTTGRPLPQSGISGGAVLLNNEIIGIVSGRDDKRNRGVHFRADLIKDFKIKQKVN